MLYVVAIMVPRTTRIFLALGSAVVRTSTVVPIRPLNLIQHMVGWYAGRYKSESAIGLPQL